MRSLRNIARIISGLVFIFSGISKGVDPMGSMYKFIDYFTAFGLDALNGLALVLGILLCTAEFIIGFAILAGIRMKLSSWGLLLFMLVFTPLTFILAINNPVSDCGCFGDAIHLTNWQTFFKNLVILFFVVIVFIQRKEFKEIARPGAEWLTVILSAFVFIIFVGLNYRYLPYIDFRPYKTGTDILESMTIPDDAPVDEYDVVLIYEKDGQEKEFTLDNYPSDSSWVFVDQKSTLVKKGYVPPIHDFSLSSIYGEDMTNIILENPGYTLLMVSKLLDEAPDGEIDKGMQVGTELKQEGFSFYILTSSTTDDMLAYGMNDIFLSGDETTIKTIIRSNPGYLLLSDGVIIKKWPYRTLPASDEILDKPGKFENRAGTSAGLRLVLLIALCVALSYLASACLKNINKK